MLNILGALEQRQSPLGAAYGVLRIDPQNLDGLCLSLSESPQSSATPSLTCSWSGSPLILVKGRTAIEGLSGSARAGLGGATGVPPTSVRPGPCSSCTTHEPEALTR